MEKILDRIESPEDLRKLPADKLEDLCAEIRDYMVRCCAENPGHLGSSLGAVELIVGLHYIYNTPQDKIVFDVGHQAYAHKILTGRREAFRSQRTEGGISGFPNRDESPYDAFGVGHSSTSISAALGIAVAARMQDLPDRAVAVIGDGAMTGGMAWEGLNNAGSGNADILVILNDNNISIDRNLGAVHNYLLKITANPTYNRVKRKVWNVLGESRLRQWIQKKVRDKKSNLVRRSGGSVFESLGFRYFGPIDGNDIDSVVSTLKRLRDLKGPRILHCITRKGCGYAPAETDPTTWHAPGRFNPETGERIKVSRPADRYQDVFGEVLTDLARRDPRVVGITPAMATGCGMNRLEKEMPDRFFDVGIEEEHAVTFAAGMAAEGMRPYCNIYSAFSQRAYDQIIHDVALQNLPVVLCFDRAGLVGEDGATHQGAFDLAAYRSIPNAVIAAPRNEIELKNLMYTGLGVIGGPFIIRYPRGCGEGVSWKEAPYRSLPAGVGEKLLEGRRLAVLAIGPVANRAVEAAKALAAGACGNDSSFHGSAGACGNDSSFHGLTGACGNDSSFHGLTGACGNDSSFHGLSVESPAVWDVRYLKPLDPAILSEAAGYDAILTVEDGCLAGGLYGAVAEALGGRVPVFGLGIPDGFVGAASQKQQRADCGIDTEGIERKMREILENI